MFRSLFLQWNGFFNGPNLNSLKCSASQEGHWKGTLLHFHCVPWLQVWKSIVFNYLPFSRHSYLSFMIFPENHPQFSLFLISCGHQINSIRVKRCIKACLVSIDMCFLATWWHVLRSFLCFGGCYIKKCQDVVLSASHNCIAAVDRNLFLGWYD